MNKLYKNKDWLYQKYIVENLTKRELIELTQSSDTTVSRYLSKYNIKKDLKAMIANTKKTMLERRGTTNPAHTKQAQEKLHATRLKNQLFNDEKWLINNYITNNANANSI